MVSTCAASNLAEVTHSACPLLGLQEARKAETAAGKHPLYDHEHGVKVARYAAAAYCHREKVWKWNCWPHCGVLSKTKEVWVVSRSEINFQSFVAWDEDLQMIVVSFRGTQATSLTNWLKTNLALGLLGLKHPYKDLPNVTLHKGFWRSFQTMKPEIVLELREKMKSHPGASLLVTGHSLGGSMATVAAFELHRAGFPVTEVLNFGSPRVGNVQFVLELSKLVPKFWRVTNHRDPVPHLPPRNVIYGFHHMPGEVHYSTETKHIEIIGVAESPKGQLQFEQGFLDILDHMTYLGVVMDSEQACKSKPLGRITYESIPMTFDGPEPKYDQGWRSRTNHNWPICAELTKTLILGFSKSNGICLSDCGGSCVDLLPDFVNWSPSEVHHANISVVDADVETDEMYLYKNGCLIYPRVPCMLTTGVQKADTTKVKKAKKKCNVPSGARAECGFSGIDDEECDAKGCCWEPAPGSPDPWCFQQGK